MTSERPDRDLDKEFEDLVARWYVTADWSPSADVDAGPDPDPAPDPPGEEPPAESGPVGSPAVPPGVNVWRGPTMWRPPEDAFESGPSGTLPDDPDEPDFVPPPVTLPPQEDIHFWGIVLGLVGGGLMLLYVALTGARMSSWWFLGAVGLFVGGFVLLILRQPPERDTTDDGTRV
ncbi:MAG TPA: hypothetical protein GXZ60_08035 [Intrasporangiaceae bacterium]|nr:hypothetical protein [Intrasporangiaceae bacterium]